MIKNDKRSLQTNPEHCAAISAGKKGVPRKPFTPEHCDALSEAKKGVSISPHTPEHCAAISAAKTGISLSPEHRTAIKKGCEKQRGGNDLVMHHYLYDHTDLSKNIVQMTRSDHTSLHNILRGLGYKVPHINNDI